MIRHSSELFIAAAQAFVGVGAAAGARSNSVVELFLTGVRTDAPVADHPGTERKAKRNNAWSAAFIHHVGYWSHYDVADGSSSWPLPAFEDCADLATYAAANAAFQSDAPFRGDIYIQHSAARRAFVRAGIVLEVTRQGEQFRSGYPFVECLVLDGNSGPCAQVDGQSIVVTRRKLSPRLGDRFIRWTSLRGRGDDGDDGHGDAMAESNDRRAA